ncbi:zinc finger protein 26-like isoform X2 [Wyeomyia smithii]|uniref:zinc finger protein 26-like isoform X2 n=1 Tax=Wyeomyia smithii TaxID=174621 RepID=UPI002467F186|nr:zinc finger protein 26-like isoform X2 [Wyeomyia smithii]
MASDNVPDISVRQNLDDCFIPGCTAYVGCNDVAFFNMSFGDLPHWWKGTAWAEKYQTELPIDAKICGMHFEERFIDRNEHKCAQCVKTFSSPANLKVHLLSHSIPRLKCDICGAVFRTKHMHMQHIIRAHTLEIKKNKEQDAPRKRRKKGIQLIRLAEEN